MGKICRRPSWTASHALAAMSLQLTYLQTCCSITMLSYMLAHMLKTLDM